MNLYIIKNVHTGETYKTPKGRSSWNKPGGAKTAFMDKEKWKRNGTYTGLDKFDDQSDWVVEQVNHNSAIDANLLQNTKETLDKLISLLKRDGIYTTNPEYGDIIDTYEGKI